MKLKLVRPVLAVLLIASVNGSSVSGSSPTDPLAQALQFLLAAHADHDISEYWLEAIISAGEDPGLWPTPLENLVDELRIPAVGTFGNDPIREIHAIAQSGYNPYAFKGRDLVADLKAAWERSNQGTGQQAFTLLALHAAAVAPSDPTFTRTLELLQRGQFADGGWACVGIPSPDCTGFALTALRATNGFLPGMEARAKLWLDAARHANGGYGNGGILGSDPLAILGIESPAPPLTSSNTQSTIWAVHGYRALGQPVPPKTWEYLKSMQRPDGGFAWRDGDTKSNLWATTEVVAGLARSFHEFPGYTHTAVVAPTDLEAGVASPFAVENPDLHAVWRVLGTDAEAEGNPALLRVPMPGEVQIHVEAFGPGIHYRERRNMTATNSPPRFIGLPDALSADRVDPLVVRPEAVDALDGPVQVSWSLADVSGIGAVEIHLTALGTYNLRLTAADQQGLEATATIPVHVANLLPTSAFGASASARPHKPVTLDGSRSTDADGDIRTYLWDFGEGSTGEGAIVTHKWAMSGEYTVKLTVIDNDGGSAWSTASVTVAKGNGTD